MIVRKLKRLLNNAITKHDDALLKYGINSIQKAGDVPDVQPASPLFTAMRPFNEELEEVPSYLKAKKKYKKELNLVKPMVDLRPLDHKDVRYMDKSFARQVINIENCMYFPVLSLGNEEIQQKIQNIQVIVKKIRALNCLLGKIKGLEFQKKSICCSLQYS